MRVAWAFRLCLVWLHGQNARGSSDFALFRGWGLQRPEHGQDAHATPNPDKIFAIFTSVLLGLESTFRANNGRIIVYQKPLSLFMSRRLLILLGLAAAISLAAAHADLTSPVLAQPFPATANLGRAAQSFDLYAYINDPNVTGTAVRVTTTVGTLGTGNIDIALTDAQTPITVANFLTYINSGNFANNVIHRAVANFVIQGGGYGFFDDGTGNFSLNLVPTFPPIQNEPGISNVRGTVAMAKVGNDPNSATSQWFINTADNSSNLDFQNGGFTVFGRVIGTGMQIADIINSSTCGPYDYSSFLPDWGSIPLTANSLTIGNLVLTSMAVVPAMTYAVSSANSTLVTANLNGNILTLTPSATLTGNTNITITATDLEGFSGNLTMPVNVVASYTYDLWKGLYNFANTTVSAETADPDGDGVPNLSEYAFGGDPLHAQAVPGAPQAEAGGGITFYQRQAANLSYAVYESTDLTNWTLIWQTSNGYGNSAVTAHTLNIVPGFDSVTVNDPSGVPKPLHFWRVQISRTL